MRAKLSSWLSLSIAILLIPSSLKAGGKDEEKNFVRLSVRSFSSSHSQKKTYSLTDKAINLVRLRVDRPSRLEPVSLHPIALAEQERTDLTKNFHIVHGVRNNTRTSNKLK